MATRAILNKRPKMKIVVNSGNIGNPVAEELAGLGAEVFIGSRAPKPSPRWDMLGIRQVPFDPNDSASMATALKGADAFFSVTPLIENLVEAGTKAVLAAKAAGVRRIVRSSALGATPNAATRLSRWHYEVEKVVRDCGIPFTILRPTNFMQNYLGYGFPETIKAKDTFFSPLASAKVSVIDTRDVSAVAVRVLTEPAHEGNSYNLTGGESLSGDDIAASFSSALGRKITHVSIPESMAIRGLAAAGVPPWMVEMLGELNILGKAGHLAAVKPDVEQVLKRKPITFARFLQDNLASFK